MCDVRSFFPCDYGFSFWLRLLLLLSSDTNTQTMALFDSFFGMNSCVTYCIMAFFVFVGEMMELCFLIIIISTESRFLIACSKVRDVQR